MKPIIFTGDSFTFGEGLELHNDMYRDFLYKKIQNLKSLEKQGKIFEWDELGYLWHRYSDFSENIVPAGKLRYELSYPALVSTHFNTLGFRKYHNGGNQKTAIEFIQKCTNKFGIDNFSIAIINLTSPMRDELDLLFDFFNNEFGIDITYNKDSTILRYLNELFLNWEHITDGDRKRFTDDKFLFGHLKKQINGDNPNFISTVNAQKLQDYFNDWDGWIEGVTKIYYTEYIKLLDTVKLPYYFISHWNKFDAEIFDKITDENVVKKIKNKIIPIYKNKKETNLIKEHNTDFYIDFLYPWSENKHPSKFGHKIIADSIIKFINENNIK